MKEKKDNLVMSPVQFNEDGHTYTLSGHSLQGVTPIIAWLFPETYKGIPQNVLDAAAEYGSMVHAKCELADSLGIVDSDPVRAYMELKEQKGLTTLCNEYLVSDEHRVASKIDVLTTDYDIIDIKTTSKVHIQHVTLQTSIYAWLFERQNDGKTAGQLYCLWLPKPQYGQPDIITLQRVPSSICEQIVDLYFSGAQPIQARALLAAVGFEVSDEKKAGDVPDELESMMDELITISRTMKELQQRESEIKDLVMARMKVDGVDKLGNDLITFTRKAAYERMTVDSTALKKDMPEVFEKYTKVTKVKESISYKVL